MTPAEDPQVLVRLIDPDMPLPAYAHPGDAGADLVAAADVELAPGQRQLVPTGIAIALPQGYVGMVVPRSGLAARSGLSIVNTPGIIDAGYRGELKICLLNLDPTSPARIARGDRIAQLVVLPVASARFAPVTHLPASDRGDGGWGSSGGVQAWMAPDGQQRSDASSR